MNDIITSDTIREMAGKIVEAFKPEKIVLFGSQARGEAGATSDVDMLVITREATEPRIMRSVPIYRLLRSYHIAKDILVYTPEEIEEYRHLECSLIGRAMREGVVLYEREG